MVLVGAITGAHGVKGEVKVKSFTAQPASIAAYGPLFDESGQRRFDLSLTGKTGQPGGNGPGKTMLVGRIQGVADRTAAEKLTNTDLYVPRDRLPPIDEDDIYYHADLIGLAAVTPEGVALGKVTGLFNFGAGDLIEITTPQGGEPMLLPFSNAVVPEVDIKAGKLTVVLPSIIE